MAETVAADDADDDDDATPTVLDKETSGTIDSEGITTAPSISPPDSIPARDADVAAAIIL